MTENIVKLKLPKNLDTILKHSKKKTVWDKFYGWVKIKIKADKDFRINVSNVYASKKFNKILEKSVRANVVSEAPYLVKKRIDLGVAMEMLNYSPSNAMSEVPEDEIWVLIPEQKEL